MGNLFSYYTIDDEKLIQSSSYYCIHNGEKYIGYGYEWIKDDKNIIIPVIYVHHKDWYDIIYIPKIIDGSYVTVPYQDTDKLTLCYFNTNEKIKYNRDEMAIYTALRYGPSIKNDIIIIHKKHTHKHT